MKQDQPTTVKIELTEGCNLRCAFCALQGIRAPGVKDYKCMTPETAALIAGQMADYGWTARLELAMHGEPTMNPRAADIIAVLRRHLPRASIMMTSNGGGILAAPGPVANVTKLFDAGLNIYAFDDYKYVKIGDKVRFDLKLKRKELTFDVFEYPKQASEARANPYTRAKPKERRLILLQDIGHEDTPANVRTLHNTAGVAAPPTEAGEGKRCARPFRELAFRWDGRVAACCNDWRGVYKVGRIGDVDLETLWQSAPLKSLRRFMYHGMRAAVGAPCKGCDSTSKRVGLLPDRMGKQTLPRPTKEDYEVVRRATGGKSFTPAVLRDWEK